MKTFPPTPACLAGEGVSAESSCAGTGIAAMPAITAEAVPPVRRATMTQDFMCAEGDILDHYRLDQTAARSGMGTLFRATDLRDGRTVAVKIPHPEMEADPVLLERFKREQEIGQLLDHPGIVKAFDGEERSRLYMVLEWVDGRLLRAVLNEARPFPPERAMNITLALCDALDAMHKRGIVHRDLKPENIMVVPGDAIKIIDFGIAMKEDARRITHVGMSNMLGTPDYISPEQVQGKRGDQRSDIYALGIMFFEMLTGTVPFSGPNPLAVMNERLLKDAPRASDVNPAVSSVLDEVIFRALEREPRNRYATASEMQWDLDNQEQVAVDDPNRPVARRPKAASLNRRILLYACLILVPLILFGLMLALSRH